MATTKGNKTGGPCDPASLQQLQRHGRMAPFKKFQRVTCVAAMLALPVVLVFGEISAISPAGFLVGYLAYMLLDAVVFYGDKYLGEKHGYRCRDCGLRYSAKGMQPAGSPVKGRNHRGNGGDQRDAGRRKPSPVV